MLGRPQAGPPSAGAALHSVFVAGKRVVAHGEVLTVNLRRLRARLWKALPRRVPGKEVHFESGFTPSLNTHECAECEYRAALDLDGAAEAPPPSEGARKAASLSWSPLKGA